MFSVLREISRDDDFRSFIEKYLAENSFLEKQTHGVRLTVDEYWLDWWLLHMSGQGPWPVFFSRFFFSPLSPRVGAAVRSHWRAILGAMGYAKTTLVDFISIPPPPRWDRYCAARGWPRNARPIRIIFSLRPGTALRELLDRRRPAWREEYPVEFEVRPLVRAHSYLKPANPLVGGVSVGPGGGLRTSSGTLGGIVRQDHSSLALTCAHVLEGPVGSDVWHPAASDHSRARRIGRIRQAAAPTPRQGPCCNRTATYASTSDVAVIEIDSSVDSNLSIRTVGSAGSCREIDSIGAYEDVVFVGKQTDRRHAQTEQLSHWQEIDIGGQPFCYQELFTIGFRGHRYVRESLSAPGDSGAWILSDPALGSRDLLGILIGGDGEKAFCSFAENAFSAVGIDTNQLLFQ